MTLDLPACTSIHLIPGSDPSLFDDHFLDSAFCTSVILNSVDEPGTNKGFRFDSLTGLRLTPTRNCNNLKTFLWHFHILFLL